MKQTGEILRKAREKKGLTVNEIGLSLKISSKILKAIEEGDLSQLPAKTFLRGFVQSYANYLRLDVAEVMKIFQAEMGSTRPRPLITMPERDDVLESSEKTSVPAPSKPSSNAGADKPLASLSKTNNSQVTVLTFLSVLLVGGIIFAKKMIDKYQREGAISEVEVTKPLDAPELSPSTTPTLAAEAPPLSEDTLPMSTPIAVAAPAASPAATAPSPAITPTATPSPTPSPTPAATPSPTPSPTPTATPSPTPVAAKSVEVIVEALDAVEIEYSTKDGVVEKISLAAEQLHTFKSRNGLRLNISNGGAVNVIVNGKDLGIPGNLGKPVKLNY